MLWNIFLSIVPVFILMAVLAATVVLMLIVTVAMSAIAARIYQRSILRMGKTVSWREALAR